MNWVTAVLTVVFGAITQGLVASYYIGKMSGKVESNSQDIETLQEDVKNHEGRISFLEGKHAPRTH